MKKLVVLIFSILITSVSCDKDSLNEDFTDDPSIVKIDGIWKVVSYEDYITESVTKKDDVESYGGMDVILTISKDSLFSGVNTVTPVSGKFKLSGRNIDVLKYLENDDVVKPEWGLLFTGAVLKFETFRVNSKQLRFYYSKSNKSVTFDSQ